MPNERALRMTAPEDGRQLLKGTIWGFADLGTVKGIRKILFNVGQYTCKAYGAKADVIKEKQGQTVEMYGQWEKLRKYPDKEEFVVKGIYAGKAFQSASAPPPTKDHNSKTVVHPRVIHPESGSEQSKKGGYVSF